MAKTTKTPTAAEIEATKKTEVTVLQKPEKPAFDPVMTIRHFFEKSGRKSDAVIQLCDTELTVGIDNDSITMALNGVTIPAASVLYLIRYGFRRTLQDAYAAKDGVVDVVAAFEQRAKKLLDGTMSERGAGDGVTSFHKRCRTIVLKALKARLGDAEFKTQWADPLKSDDETVRDNATAQLDEIASSDAVVAKMREIIEREKQERDEMADLLIDM